MAHQTVAFYECLPPRCGPRTDDHRWLAMILPASSTHSAEQIHHLRYYLTLPCDCFPAPGLGLSPARYTTDYRLHSTPGLPGFGHSAADFCAAVFPDAPHVVLTCLHRFWRNQAFPIRNNAVTTQIPQRPRHLVDVPSACGFFTRMVNTPRRFC